MDTTERDLETKLMQFIDRYERDNLGEGSNADSFFNTVGGDFTSFPPQTFEDLYNGIKVYKMMLKMIKNHSNEIYNEIHKGTPFFFIGWYSFLLKNYNEAIYYVDAAMNEDKKNHDPTVWPQSGAARLLMLESSYDDFFKDFTDTTISDILNEELIRFSSIFEDFKLSEFKDNFINPLILDENLSSDIVIITAFYSFILEKNDVLDMIELRGAGNGTIEPMITHLFKGGLIFESLLKKYHITHEGNTLGDIFRDSNLQGSYSLHHGNDCRADDLDDIVIIINSSDYNEIERAFYTTCRIRNTTSHRLTWNDIFSLDNYEKMYQQVLNAILLVIHKNIN